MMAMMRRVFLKALLAPPSWPRSFSPSCVDGFIIKSAPALQTGHISVARRAKYIFRVHITPPLSRRGDHGISIPSLPPPPRRVLCSHLAWACVAKISCFLCRSARLGFSAARTPVATCLVLRILTVRPHCVSVNEVMVNLNFKDS